jgi:general secretion pathway protein K
MGALEQAYQYTLGIEDWAGVILKDDLDQNLSDSCDDAWATIIPPIPIPGGQMQGRLYDLQALLNVNNVIGNKNERGEQIENKNAVKRLQRLLMTTTTGFSADPIELSDAILDWIDEDNKDRSNLAESSYYKSLTPAYLAANGRITSLSEIRIIKGFDETITNETNEEEVDILYKKVIPYLAALPSNQISINVNTAPREVLLSIAGVTEQQITNILEDRKGGAFESITDFVTSVGGGTNSNPIEQQGLTVESNYFLLKGSIQINNVRLFINSVLFRDNSKKQVHVIQREFNEISQDEIVDTCKPDTRDTDNTTP